MGSALHNVASAAVVAGAATLLGDKLSALPHAALASVVFVALRCEMAILYIYIYSPPSVVFQSRRL